VPHARISSSSGRETFSMAGGDEKERRCAVGVQLGISSLPIPCAPPSWDDSPSPLSTPSRFTRDFSSRPDM
jgi:hypothetical protein